MWGGWREVVAVSPHKTRALAGSRSELDGPQKLDSRLNPGSPNPGPLAPAFLLGHTARAA